MRIVPTKELLQRMASGDNATIINRCGSIYVICDNIEIKLVRPDSYQIILKSKSTPLGEFTIHSELKAGDSIIIGGIHIEMKMNSL